MGRISTAWNTLTFVIGLGGGVLSPFAFYQDAQDVAIWAKNPWLEWWHIAFWAVFLGLGWHLFRQQIRLSRIESPILFQVELYRGRPKYGKIGVSVTNKSQYRTLITGSGRVSRREKIRIADKDTEGHVYRDFRVIWDSNDTVETNLNPEETDVISLSGGLETKDDRTLLIYGLFANNDKSQSFDIDDNGIEFAIKLMPDRPAKNPEFLLRTHSVLGSTLIQSQLICSKSICERLVRKVLRLKKSNERISE